MHLAAPGSFILSTTPGNTYDYYYGTSMATPHVTGVAALLKAQSPARDWRAIKNLILAGTDGDMYPDDDHLITRKRLNARHAVACANRTVLSRLRPIRTAVHAVVGHPMELSALHIQCAAPNGNVTVTVSPGGQTITLRDDGAGIDQEAGDGIYSAEWTPTAQGLFSLTFPGPDVVSVQVLASAYSVRRGALHRPRDHGYSAHLHPGEPALITTPFPLRFGGGSFTTLVVDERGALHFNGGGYNADLAIFNEPLPSPFNSTLIAPFWDQIYLGYPGLSEVVWEVTGTTPNRELVVEWRNMQRSDRFCVLFEGFVSFQVVFFEGSSDVLFNYRDTTFGGECPDLDRGGVGDGGHPGRAGRRHAVQLQHSRAGRRLGVAVDARPGAAAGDRRDAGLSGLRHRRRRWVGGRDLRRPEHRHRDAHGRGQDRGAVQHRVRWRLLAGRRTDPGRHRALQPDVGRHVRGRRHLHRWRQPLARGPRSRAARMQRPISRPPSPSSGRTERRP